MAQTLYDYQWTFDSNTALDSTQVYLQGQIPSIDDQTLKNQLAGAINTEAQTQFLAKMSQAGHYIVMGALKTDITSYTKTPMPTAFHAYILRVNVKTKTTVNFQTDVADMYAHNSPQLVAEISFLIGSIAVAILSHQLIFLGILALVAFAIVLSQLSNLTRGIVDVIQSGGQPFLIAGVIAVVIVAGLVFLAWKGPRKGRRGTSKRKKAKK